MKPNYQMGVTRALAIAGCTDFGWCDEESRWKGSEVHRIVELRLRGMLLRPSVPHELKGYLDALERFLLETSFIPHKIEESVASKELHCRGKLDAAGLLHGKKTIVDFKSGAISPAVALQLCLYGHMLDPTIWWNRAAVQLKPDGTYSMKAFPLMNWSGDLATAFAAVRIARWKLQNGLEKT